MTPVSCGWAARLANKTRCMSSIWVTDMEPRYEPPISGNRGSRANATPKKWESTAIAPKSDSSGLKSAEGSQKSHCRSCCRRSNASSGAWRGKSRRNSCKKRRSREIRSESSPLFVNRARRSCNAAVAWSNRAKSSVRGWVWGKLGVTGVRAPAIDRCDSM
jgi:hypothetical protein